MTSRRILSLALTLALFVSAAFANKKDGEAAALVEHAKQLSDIRAEGAPAFRLKLSFKMIKDDGSFLEGAYTEVWVSKERWHRETVLGDFRRIQVAAGRKRWLLDSAPLAPEHIGDVQSFSEVNRFRPEAWKPGKVTDREVKGLTVRCLETAPDTVGGKSALCFDKSNGALVVEVTPLETGARIADKTCFFADYQKFGDRILARSYECGEDRRPRLSARVVELIAEAAPDAALFAPPNGGKESVNCLGTVRPPVPLHTEEPIPQRAPRGVVVINLVVGTDGKPHDLSVISSPNRDFDQATLEAAGKWTFKPGTCEGEPAETTINLEMMTATAR